MHKEGKIEKQKWISYSARVGYLLFIFLVSTVVVSASPPSSPYAPGETLNPSCAVLDTNCTVTQIYVSTTTLNYGIGTTSPFARFSIAGTSTAQTVLFAISTSTASATSTALIVDGNGRVGIGMAVPLSDFSVAGQSYFGRNVGIGTTSPSKTLSVQSDALISGNLSVAGLTATSSITFSGLGTDMLTALNGSGNLMATSTPTAARYIATSTIASIFPYASSTALSVSGTAFFDSASTTNLTVSALNSASCDVKSTNGVLSCGTDTGGTGWASTTDAFSIYFNGRDYVGIGTSTPSARLSVQQLNGTTIGTYIAGYANATADIFRVSTSTLTATSTAFVINNNGKVGIGTTTPYAQLSVTGLTASGYYNADSVTSTSTFAGGLSVIGSGINFSTSTNFYQNNQSFLTSSTTAAGNLSIGYQAAPLLDQNGGTNNTFVGYQAGQSATSSSYNTAVGYQALNKLVSNSVIGYGSDNTAIGFRSLYNNTYGTDNTAIGYSSLGLNTTGNYNNAIGFTSLAQNRTGNSNQAFGLSALQQNRTGSNNVALGESALANNGSATSTTAIGQQAAQGIAQYNNQGGVYLGYLAGYSAGTNSDYNTLLGYQSGYGVTTGAGNIIIGANVDAPNATGNNQLNIGNLLYGTGIYSSSGASPVVSPNAVANGKLGVGTTTPFAKLSVAGDSSGTFPLFAVSTSTLTSTSTAFIIDSNGKVGIGTSSPGFAFGVVGTVGLQGLTSNAAGNAVCILANNEITTAGAATCSGVSSQRFKHDIASSTLGLDTILPMRPVSFRYNEGYGDSGKVEQFGLIAEEMYNIDPRLVILDAEGLPTTVRYDFLAPILIKAVQELNLKLDELASTTNVANVSGEPSGTALESIWTSIISRLSDVGVYISQAFSRITNLFAGTLHIEEKLCADDVCVTKDQLKTLLRQVGADAVGSAEQSGDTNSVETDAVDTEPPVIILNGNNPATLEKGATYIDLGAVVTDNVDHNLGVYVIGDQIDTTVLGEHTITYSATDQAGNTATTTRTVIVSNPNETTEISTTTSPIISPSSENTATSTANFDSDPAFDLTP